MVLLQGLFAQNVSSDKMFKRESLAAKTNYTYREFSRWEEDLKATPLDKKVPAKYLPKFWQKINTGISFKNCTWKLGAAELSNSNSTLNSERQHSLLCWHADTHPCCRLFVCFVVREEGDGMQAGLQAGGRLHIRGWDLLMQ